MLILYKNNKTDCLLDIFYVLSLEQTYIDN